MKSAALTNYEALWPTVQIMLTSHDRSHFVIVRKSERKCVHSVNKF